jgi:hypothetical protein
MLLQSRSLAAIGMVGAMTAPAGMGAGRSIGNGENDVTISTGAVCALPGTTHITFAKLKAKQKKFS